MPLKRVFESAADAAVLLLTERRSGIHCYIFANFWQMTISISQLTITDDVETFPFIYYVKENVLLFFCTDVVTVVGKIVKQATCNLNPGLKE